MESHKAHPLTLEEKRAAALRENLKRRKDQDKARYENEKDSEDDKRQPEKR